MSHAYPAPAAQPARWQLYRVAPAQGPTAKTATPPAINPPTAPARSTPPKPQNPSGCQRRTASTIPEHSPEPATAPRQTPAPPAYPPAANHAVPPPARQPPPRPPRTTPAKHPRHSPRTTSPPTGSVPTTTPAAPAHDAPLPIQIGVCSPAAPQGPRRSSTTRPSAPTRAHRASNILASSLLLTLPCRACLRLAKQS